MEVPALATRGQGVAPRVVSAGDASRRRLGPPARHRYRVTPPTTQHQRSNGSHAAGNTAPPAPCLRHSTCTQRQRHSFTIGTLPISIRPTVPADPKSMVAVARGPAPAAAITVPTPYLSWLTWSQTSNCNAGLPEAAFQPVNDVVRMPPAAIRACAESSPQPPPRPHLVTARGPDELSMGSSRRQSSNSAGISSKNRDAGLVTG